MKPAYSFSLFLFLHLSFSLVRYETSRSYNHVRYIHRHGIRARRLISSSRLFLYVVLSFLRPISARFFPFHFARCIGTYIAIFGSAQIQTNRAISRGSYLVRLMMSECGKGLVGV